VQNRSLIRITFAIAAIGIAALVIGSACRGSQSSGRTTTATAVGSAAPSATATPARSPEEEVGTAYLAYWDVYAQAVLTLDNSHLADAMTGMMLDQTTQEIANLRQRGRAAMIQVEHHFLVTKVDKGAGVATVVDDYLDKSYQLDANTKQPVATATPIGIRISDTYFLVWTGEKWKVRNGIRSTN
jgi:hypothetical protein